MNRRLISEVALIGVAVLALAGCGQATQASRATAADDPVPTSVPSSTSSGGASVPAWPSVGCDSRSVVSVDYGRMPRGYATPEQAVKHSPAVGLPDGVLRLAPYAGKGPAQVWVVDPDTDEIQAQVSIFRGPDGWFVDGVMTCS